MNYDVVIKNGLYFDGTGAPGAIRHIGVRDGRVVEVSNLSLIEEKAKRVIDATDRWVMPGFLDIHTHYDAEVVVAPALRESVRQGVTTVALGSCSLSMITSEPEDCADLFTRVEAVPREAILPVLRDKKTWRTPAEYRAFYEGHPIGPNVMCFVGHSDIRVTVMGIERASSRIKPTEAELIRMERLLEDSLDAGCIGMSVMTSRLDKMDGDRVWSRPLPSTYANWSEFGRLFRILRRRGAIMQGAPDAVGKVNIFAFLFHAIGLFGRSLKMTMLTAMDLKSQPYLHRVTRASAWIVNRLLGADLRWQALPAPFSVYADGLDIALFEEFSVGEKLRDIKNEDDRYRMAEDPAFRKAFKKAMKATLSIGLWDRKVADVRIVACPDASMIGRTLGEIGKEQGQDGIDAFVELAVKYRKKLRTTLCIGNERVDVMHKLISSPNTHIGFADSGAHIRGLAKYNFGLRLLKYVRDAELAGQPFMELGRAVHRLTGELADWFGVDAGHIRVGDRADMVIVNPQGLDKSLDEVAEAPIENINLVRLVNRNDAAVDATLINGRVAYERGAGFADYLGKERGYGIWLSARLAA
ncbi:MAG: N-acyl-D-amino-acid deacylase family protein [Nevskiales bacterium]